MIVEIVLSIIGIALGVAGFQFCSWKAGQPNDTPEPRMVPWRLLSFIPVVFSLLIVAHLMNLAGFETGPGKSPFRF